MGEVGGYAGQPMMQNVQQTKVCIAIEGIREEKTIGHCAQQKRKKKQVVDGSCHWDIVAIQGSLDPYGRHHIAGG